MARGLLSSSLDKKARLMSVSHLLDYLYAFSANMWKCAMDAGFGRTAPTPCGHPNEKPLRRLKAGARPSASGSGIPAASQFASPPRLIAKIAILFERVLITSLPYSALASLGSGSACF